MDTNTLNPKNVHNNFYFLRQLSNTLQPRLQRAVLSECFSQRKDELLLRFETATQPFLIRVSMLPDLSCLSFPDDFQRARRNSVDLFPELIGRRVSDIRQFNNERSFAIRFSDNHQLLFKMHGTRSNVIHFSGEAVAAVFRNNLMADFALAPGALDRTIDWRFEHFEKHLNDLQATYFTFGKIAWRYLAQSGFAEKAPAERWEMVQALRDLLEKPRYYITWVDEKPVLSLISIGDVKETYTDPVAAANAYYYAFTHLYTISKEKTALLNLLRGRLKAGQNYIDKNAARLSELQKDAHYRIWADLIMANLHAIPPGSEKVTLENFYDGNRPVEIRLKKDLSPQKNAEVFYRKAKNQHLETDRIEKTLQEKAIEQHGIREKIEQVNTTGDLKALRALATAYGNAENKMQGRVLPYHAFDFKGYSIWVGKNAQSNDTLTLKHSYKDDLWLHAKDVSGSHVLIKYQAGKNIPRDVIEYAGGLAAYHSKRRNESLCPVVVTPKKFVRKRKGDPPGTVVVEREQVIMVQPQKGQD